MGKKGLVALLCLSTWCIVIVIVLWLFLAVQWVGMQCVIVVFPNHTHLLFLRVYKVSKAAKVRNRYIQEPHLAQDTNEKATNSQ